MSITTSDGPAILAGYLYKLRLETDLALFPVAAAITAHVRASAADDTILATLSTANGGLTRISDTLLEISIAAADTADMTPGTVVLDMVRTDVSPHRHLGFQVKIPVAEPVTRDLA